MTVNTHGFDIWTYHLEDSEPKYLLLHTTQEKADKWFNGGRFWQIPGEFLRENETIKDGIKRCLEVNFKLNLKKVWAVEHTYSIYNRRRNAIEIIPVFAAQVNYNNDIPLSSEHAEFGWKTAEQCDALLSFRGLKEGLYWTRTYITENKNPRKEFRL